ncbi:MAG: response regulator transcription factor [Paracoccaceae bacterium]
MGKRILILEDEPNIVESLTFILNRAGFEVTTAADGAAAMGAIEGARPDLVILDVMLPNRSGFDILRDIRGKSATEALPVLMLTARGQARDRQEAEDIGADEFMTKPFSNEEIVATVRRLAGA